MVLANAINKAPDLHKSSPEHWLVFYFLKILFIYFIFRQWGREGGREGEKHQCVVASLMPPTGDLAHNPGRCPDWESNCWSRCEHWLLNVYQHTTGPRKKKAWERGEHREHLCISGGQRRHQWKLGNESMGSASNPTSWLLFSSFSAIVLLRQKKPANCGQTLNIPLVRLQKRVRSGTHLGNV